MDFLQWVPLLSALGAAGVVGTWVGGGRARREVRSAILTAIANTESERWAEDPEGSDYPRFVAAVRELETAALIARVPKGAVHHYVVLAEAARNLSDDAVEFFPGDTSFWGPIDGYFDTLVRDSAAMLTRLAWTPWRGRLKLRWSLRRLRARALKFDDVAVTRRLATSRSGTAFFLASSASYPESRTRRQSSNFRRSRTTPRASSAWFTADAATSP